MEVRLLDHGNNGKDDIHASKSNGTRDMLQCTDIVVHDDDLESEACEHFSIREYVTQASKRDPHSCSPFGTDKLTLELLPPAPQKKFRRWDCSGCVSKVISTEGTQNLELALSSDQSANNNVGTCSISILGTSLVPLNIHGPAEKCKSLPSSMNESNSKKEMMCATIGGGHFQTTSHADSPDASDNEPLSTLIKSEKRRVMQDPDKTKAHMGMEKSKEVDELMATTSRNSDLSESPVASKISKVQGKKTRKVRSIAEIIGTDNLVPAKNGHTPDGGTAWDLKPVKENMEDEVAGKSGFNRAKLKKKNKGLEVVVPSVKQCTPVDGTDEDLIPIKETLGSAVACKSLLSKVKTKKICKKLELAVPPHNECSPIDCRDEDLAPVNEDLTCEIASTSGLMKAKSKTKYKALEVVDDTSRKMWLKKGKKTATHSKCATVKNLQGQSVTHPSSRLLGFKKPSVDISDKNGLLMATVVRRKRTKVPRKFVHAAGIGDEIACTKSNHKPLQLIGNKEAISKKRKIDDSKPECSAHRIQKKKQRISEDISNDIPMDIVELLARSLRDKHLTDETDSNTKSNTYSNSRESPQNMLPNRTLRNFSMQKSAFNRTTETSALKYVPRPIYCQSSTHVGNANFSTSRIDPNHGYMNHFANGSAILQPGNGRCLDLGCTLLQLSANPVHQTELYRNEVIPSTHLLHLMNASTSSSPNLNLRGFTRPYPLPLMPNNCQIMNQDPCKLFRPQPRLGVLGSQLQKEITSPSSNCGTQSGFKIGNGPVPEEGICTVNRNPADFTVVDENNEYMIDGRDIKPITAVYAGNLDRMLYLSRGIGSERGFPTSRLLYNRVGN